MKTEQLSLVTKMRKKFMFAFVYFARGTIENAVVDAIFFQPLPAQFQTPFLSDSLIISILPEKAGIL